MTTRRNITQPADWWAAFEAAAKASGQNLSEWIGQQCQRGLRAAERKQLSDRPTPGRPEKKE